jgi:ATP-dependent Clp protease ATP-binding subunit ClpC
MKIKLSLTPEAKEFVSEKGYDPQFGARPLHRAIQKFIEDPLAEYILNESPGEGAELDAAMNEAKDGIVITAAVTAAATGKKKKGKEVSDLGEVEN